MTELGDATRLSEPLFALAAVFGVILAGLYCILRFFTEPTARRMARLSENAKNRKPVLSDVNDPQGLGGMMGRTDPILKAAPSRSHSDPSSDSGGSCGDGGSGE